MILLSNNETVNDTQWNCSGHNQYGVSHMHVQLKPDLSKQGIYTPLPCY